MALVWIGLLALATPAPPPVPAGTARSQGALAACHAAEALSDADGTKHAKLDDAVVQAEAAVTADDGDALAHFALFCALGERMRLDGAGVGTLFTLRRARREIDRTLELAPDYSDALYGKGALLLHAPRLLGGDAAEGERLLRRALELDPDYFDARLDLARALADRGAHADARATATEALATAERRSNAADAAAARAFLAELPPP